MNGAYMPMNGGACQGLTGCVENHFQPGLLAVNTDSGILAPVGGNFAEAQDEIPGSFGQCRDVHQ
jgi:hypothetical protein